MQVSPSVYRLTTCCADAPAHSHHSLGILRGARAIADADLAIAASCWAVLFWRRIQREKLTRISGLALFKALLETPQARVPQNLFLFCQECSQEFVRLDDVATFSMATH